MARAAGILGAALLAAVLVVGVLALAGIFGDGDEQGPGRASTPSAGAQGGVAGERVNDIYSRLRDSVVFIQARVRGPGESPFGLPGQGGVATGSGFLYDERGRLVTNAHVVEDAQEVVIEARQGGIPARVIGVDLSTDLAVLQVDPERLDAEPIPLADSDAARVGDPVLAIGSPLGLEDTATTGIVSAVQRQIPAPDGFAIEDAIQSDAAINPGNSGGPLLNDQGQVLGVNSQIASAGGAGTGFIGIGFSVPSNTVEQVVPQLIAHGEISRPYLGVATRDVNAAISRQLGLGADRGALVVSVNPGSPADRAGLRGTTGGPLGAVGRGGDVIVGLGGLEITGAQDLSKAVAETGVGETVTLRFVRGGQRITRRVRIADRPR